MIPSFRPTLTHPAVWTFATCWLLAASWLLSRGQWVYVAGSVGVALVILILCAITARLTEEPPRIIPASTRERVYLGIQLVLLVGVVVVTAFDGLHFHGVTTFTLYVPIWTEASDWAGRMGEQYLSREWVGGPYQALANPMRYALLPLVFLLPLTGARYLGLGRGHRVVRVMALWCALPLIIAATFLFLGQSTLVGFGKRLVSNTLQNGPFEEFLFRGAIQTRLTALLGPAWGLTLSSLAFGVWHLGLGYTMMGKQSVADGLAVTVLIQTVTGVGFGYLFHRTRNLMAGSVFHVVSNSAV